MTTSSGSSPSGESRRPSAALDEPIVGRRIERDEAMAFAADQVRKLITAHPGATPTYTEQGRWVFGDDPWAPSWSGGFLTGMMWIFAEQLDDEWWLEQAQKYCRILEQRKNDGTTHDIGFMFEPSWGRWYDRTGDDHAKAVLVTAGRTMAARLRQPGGYLSTWVDPGSSFIDVMMNVGIIFRAADYTGDERLFEVALRHAHTSRRYLTRGDGSTVHEGWFDTDTGEFLRAATHQGYRTDSTWARGQAWAIYGFTTAFAHTGDRDLLETARATADYYLRETPDHGIPPNDWHDPAPDPPWEASAAAIASAGLQHLAAVEADPERQQDYAAAAHRIIDSLCTSEFIAIDQSGWEGIIRHATYHQVKELGVDESVMWGDHYFVEALDLETRPVTEAGGAASP